MTTSQLDTSLADEWSSAWREFHASPQHELIQLIGSYAVGGIWDNNMSEMYFRAASVVNANLNRDEIVAVRELYGRITTEVKQGVHRTRTQEEIYNILDFWWKLQRYRSWWLWENRREDTNAEILTGDEVRQVKTAWEQHEMQHEVTGEKKKNKKNTCQLYTMRR